MVDIENMTNNDIVFEDLEANLRYLANGLCYL